MCPWKLTGFWTVKKIQVAEDQRIQLEMAIESVLLGGPLEVKKYYREKKEDQVEMANPKRGF